MSSIKRYEMQETGVLHLKDSGDELMYADGPDGEPDLTKPMRVRVYGPGTAQYAKALNKRQNRQVEMLKQRKVKETADEAIQEQAEFNAACTASFENIDSDHGHSGYDLFMEIYCNQKLSFIRQQVGVYINETANFSPPSTKVSASTSAT